MYGIDKTMDFSFLSGKELLQICIGLYQVILNFTDNVVISAECVVRLTDVGGATLDISFEDPKKTRELTGLLGATVEKVTANRRGELTLVFSHGYELMIVDSNESAESFTVTAPGKEIVV